MIGMCLECPFPHFVSLSPPLLSFRTALEVPDERQTTAERASSAVCSPRFLTAGVQTVTSVITRAWQELCT